MNTNFSGAVALSVESLGVMKPARRLLHNSVIARPELGLGLFCAFQAAFWTILPTMVSTSVSQDTVESYLWGHEWIIGSYKHPNLPGWCLEAGRLLTGSIIWPAYFVGQLFVVVTYICVFLLGREMLGAPRALLATVALAALYYTANFSTMTNHNVAMMPFWPAVALLIWRARNAQDSRIWIALGFVAALGLYAKLASGVLLLTAGLWIVYDERLRAQLQTLRPWIGFFVFVVATLPLFNWLRQTDASSLAYAAEVAHSDETSLKFLVDQIIVFGGVAMFAHAIGLRDRRALLTLSSGTPELDPIATTFLAVMLMGPIILTVIIGKLTGAGLNSKWGAPMMSLCGVLIVATNFKHVNYRILARAFVCAIAMVIAFSTAFATYLFAAPRLTGRTKRESWPQAEIATRFQALWEAKMGTPLRIVAGSRWTAGMVALKPGSMPSVLIDGDYTRASWITPQMVAEHGMLVVWEFHVNHERKTPSEGIPRGEGASYEEFDYPFCRGACTRPIRIYYSIIPPTDKNLEELGLKDSPIMVDKMQPARARLVEGCQ